MSLGRLAEDFLEGLGWVTRRLRFFLTRWFPAWVFLLFLAMLTYLARLVFGAGGAGLPPIEAITRSMGWTTPLLVSSVALGFPVMAIIQLVKPLLRAAFHRRELLRWLSSIRHDRDYLGGWYPLEGSRLELFQRKLMRGGFQPLLELPLEQLAAQIQADAELDLTLAGSDNPEQDGLASERAKLSYQLQRSIDAFQIRVRSPWRRQLQALSLGLSLLLTTLVASVFGLWGVNLIGTAFLVLLTSALAGFFATVARDAVAVLERLRRW